MYALLTCSHLGYRSMFAFIPAVHKHAFPRARYDRKGLPAVMRGADGASPMIGPEQTVADHSVVSKCRVTIIRVGRGVMTRLTSAASISIVRRGPHASSRFAIAFVLRSQRPVIQRWTSSAALSLTAPKTQEVEYAGRDVSVHSGPIEARARFNMARIGRACYEKWHVNALLRTRDGDDNGIFMREVTRPASHDDPGHEIRLKQLTAFRRDYNRECNTKNNASVRGDEALSV